MKKTTSILLTTFLIIAILTGCAGGGGTQAQGGSDGDLTIWRFAGMGSETHPASLGAMRFAEEIHERIGDEVEVQIFLNGVLGTIPDQQINGLLNEIIHFCDITLSNVPEFSSAFIPLDAPYLFLDRETAFSVLDGEVGDMMRQRYEEESGIRLIAVFDHGFRHVTNSRNPIYTPGDIQGLNIRTLANNIHMEAFSSFGALPTVMAFGEVMTALQQSTVDGQENSISTIWDANMHEMQNYLSMTSHVYGFLGVHMSAAYYHSLPEHWRVAIDEAAAIAEAYQREIAYRDSVAALQYIEESGLIQINHLTHEQMMAFRDLSQSAWELAAAQSGQEYFDTIAAEAGVR